MANTTWEPERFSNLNKLLEESLELTDESPTFEQLKKQLEKLKPDMAGLFEYPGKNAQHRSELEKGTPTINGEKFKVSSDFITEAKKLSDFLDIDEDIASALVHKATPYEKRYELPAAETSVLLFYSEREAKVMCLNTLFAGGASASVDESVRAVLEKHTSEILSTALKASDKMFPERLLSTMGELKARQDKITAYLNGPTADIPYQRDVVEFVHTKLGEERKQLAMLLFGIVRDYQLNSNELIAVVAWLRTSNIDDSATLRMVVALLVALGTAAEGTNQELSEVAALDKISYLVRDSDFLVKLNAEIVDKQWNDEGMKGFVWLQWALLALFGMKRSPGFDRLIGYREDRVENIAEQAIQMGAYRFAVDYLLGFRITDDLEYDLSAEFEVLQRQHAKAPAATTASDSSPENIEKAASPRYPHFTDIPADFQWQIERTLEDTLSTFIERMSSLIRRVRYSEEDAIYQAQQAEQQRLFQEEQRQQQQQQQLMLQGGYRYSRPIAGNAGPSASNTAAAAAAEPRRDTECLFLWITVLYSEKPDAGLRFWGQGSGSSHVELDDRLSVFLRWGSDCREQGMIRGYFNMLSALACGPQASICAHEFMSASSGSLMSPSRSQVASNQAPLCSWSALFGALDFYASSLRENEPDPLAETPEIPEAEISLLRSFLRLCRSVVRYSIVARTTLYESPEYNAIMTIFNLLGCVVPVPLKASLISTIAAFGELNPEIPYGDDAHADSIYQAINEMARRSWILLEQSQTLPTTNNLDALRDARPADVQQVPMPGKTPSRRMNIGRGSTHRPLQNRGGIVYELEEVEAAVETYPEVRAFVRLISSLIHSSSGAPALSNMERDPVLYSVPSPSIPTDLGESYRVPGVSPYVGFVLDNVLLKAEQRSYRYPSEKWSVYALSLDVVERSLGTLDLSAFIADTSGQNTTRLSSTSIFQQNGGSTSALQAIVTHPGFEIAIRILCGSKLLDTLLHVLAVGVDALNTSTGDLGTSIELAVARTLRILLRVLRIQNVLLRHTVPVLLESSDALGFPINLPRSLTTLEQLLLTRKESVIRIITYIGCAASPEICLATIKIIHILSDSSVFNGVDDGMTRGSGSLTLNRLVGMIDQSDESVRILHGFINCLELEDENSAESQSGALIGEAAKGFTSGLEDQQPLASSQSIPIAIIDLLLANLSPSKPAPTIAHYLLGFSLSKPATDDLPDPSQRATCLHTILDLLRKDRLASGDAAASTAGDDYSVRSSGLLVNRPRLAERCYHLIYHLCSDPVTSDVTLRFLRARENFFSTQISTTAATIVPDLQQTDAEAYAASSSDLETVGYFAGLYGPIRVYAQMHARAWLWRSTALELHSLVLQDSRSRAKLIVEWLVGDANQSSGSDADENDVFSVLPGNGAQNFLDSRMRVLALFDCLRQAYRDSSFVLRRQQRETEHAYLSGGDSLGGDNDSDIADEGVASFSSPSNQTAALDTDILNVDVSSCIVSNERGCAVYDLHALVALLQQAEQSLESSGALNSSATRQRVHRAIRRIVIRSYFSNQERELFFAYSSALRGWKEVAEIVVSSAWDKIESGGRAGRERTAFQMLRRLVQVLSENDPVYNPGKLISASSATGWWIEPPSAEQELRHSELLTALAPTLSLVTERLALEWTRSGVLSRASLAMNKPGVSGQSRQLPPAIDSRLPVEPLLDAWKLLVGSALTPAAQSSLHLRGNVYASMLHFLGGIRKLATAEAEDTPGLSMNKQLSSSVTKHRSKSRLVSGALDVLADSTLGDRLLESVSTDAADASDAWKTVAFSLLDALSTLFGFEPSPNRAVMFLARKNFFSSYIGSIIRREDQAIQATLQLDPASLNSLYIYEAKMAFFLRIAQRQDGAEKLLENGILDVLADCAFLDLKPSVRSDGGQTSYADAFIPARAERYHQLLMPALDLMLVLVTRIGRDNLTLWMKAARFISQHYGVLEAILKEASLPAQPLSIALLTEAKAISALVFYISRQRAVLDREAALAGSGHVGISSLNLPMLALLSKLCASSTWTRRLITTNDVERAQSQVPASPFDDDVKDSVASALGERPINDIQHTVFGQQASELVDAIVHNVISYAQTITDQSVKSPTPDETRTFRPAFTWSIEHSRESDYTPSLATLVAFVRRSMSQIERGRKARNEKLRLSKNSSEMTAADLRKLIDASPYVELSDDLNTSQMRALASVLLAQQGQRIGRSITMLVAAVEQALVLLWRHLSYFINTNADNGDLGNGYALGGGAYGGHSGGNRLSSSMSLPSPQERDMLKSDASITLPPIFATLSEMKLTTDEFANASTHTSFIQMLVRRIKDLVLRDVSVIS